MSSFPADLVPPTVALAKAVPAIPESNGLPGGAVYEPKWDGFRLTIIKDGDVHLWSRQKRELTDAFPDLARAAHDQLPDGVIVDGEAIVWSEGRLDFGALQQRLVLRHERREREVSARPAAYAAFDVLAVDYRDARELGFADRRSLLEELAGGWQEPLTLSPATRDEDEAAEWFATLPEQGIEGLVVKGAAQPYRGNRRDWVKVKHRDTVDVIVGAVNGTIAHPRELIIGLPDDDGALRIVGHSTALSSAAAGELKGVIAKPAGSHPWPKTREANRWRHESSELTLVEPFVIEISADTARDDGVFRHPVRFVRLRPEMTPADLGRRRA
ncbi:ATP-dependent DNA ligase [Gryllotalpicola daejeonensis]|uniref:ATP-dependent DNA ligase n=1 Tax=Gryllotalpicola daejeonensis TaxID=993087 RepID=A0ABP7ZGJ4_9MICO